MGGFRVPFETEVALRRPFLWLPVAAGTGVVLYLYADREPSLWLIAPAAVFLGVLAYLARANRVAFFFLCRFCAVFAGELSAALRTARVAAPVIRIVTLQGFIEEMDFRRNGARFLLRVHSAEGLAPEQTPFRVRLSMRRAPAFRGRHLCEP
jgi:competence protein ComEC